MAKFKYDCSELSSDKLTEFQEYHEDVFKNKRKHTRDLFRFRFSLSEDKKPDCLPNIIDYAADLLTDKLGVTNFNKNKNVVEFHQINLFGDNKISSFKWHQDIGIIYPFMSTYTVIFYLRKDKTVNGGNLHIRPYIQTFCFKPKSELVDISNGKIFMFDGAMEHKPEVSSGFGCRDIIVVFFHRRWD